jgi:hypothetical protein
MKTCAICGTIIATATLMSNQLTPIICRECEFIHQPHTVENIPLIGYFDTVSYSISGVSDLKSTLASLSQFPDEI